MSLERATQYDADGVIGRDEQGRPTVRFRRHLNHTIERVWQVVTEPEEASRSWVRGLEIDARVGGRVALTLGQGSVSEGTILAFEPPTLIEYSLVLLNAPEGTDSHILRWELRKEGEGCVLTLTNTFNAGEVRVSNAVVCGWHHCLELLEAALEGPATDWRAMTRDRVVELYWHYRNKPRPTTRED